MIELSRKGKDLIQLYSQMADQGYLRKDGSKVDVAFADFESRRFRSHIKEIFDVHKVTSVLDYGCGGSDWTSPGFDTATQKSAVEYYGLADVYRYEPARGIDERGTAIADCVISFDVLEHIFVSDVPKILDDIFRIARSVIVLNVACYPAAARLPNGENAHITVRPSAWWKGQVDAVATNYPEITVYLACSSSYGEISYFHPFSEKLWQTSATFVTKN